MMKDDFIRTYEAEYLKLNIEQKKAVDTVEGPVMVIAGPGTGKTQILSRRVANLLLNHHISPEEIVCLTYTEAGASEMVDRLEKLTGEICRNIRVSTIHSFCSELILNNPSKFDDHPQVISSAIKYKFLKEIIDNDISEDDVLYKVSGDRYFSIDQLLELHSRMKREKLQKNEINREIEDYLETIKNSSQDDAIFSKFWYKSGAFHYKNFEAELAKFKKIQSGIEIVEKYNNKINSSNYFDFDDMIIWVIEKLRCDIEFQNEISNKIKYLFVDEYQDTSVMQNHLVDLLVERKEIPNIFVVGDDDQSIYRFQGVSADNISNFEKKYSPTKIVLTSNYRSSQIIIDAAKQLISRNPREEKQLIAAGTNKDYPLKKPTLTAYSTEEEEMLGVFKEIQLLLKSGVSPSEIGVIYGRNNYGKKFAKLLRNNGVFVQIKDSGDLFTDPFYIKIFSLLKYVSKSNRDIGELRKILYFDFFPVTPDEIASIRNTKNNGEITNETIKGINEVFEKLRKKYMNPETYYSPTYILKEIIKVFQIDEYITKSNEKYHLISVLKELYNLMNSEMTLNSNLLLREFLEVLKNLQLMKCQIPIENIASIPNNCIQLMTAHGSKGLEFDYVFIMKCNDTKNATWPGGENNRGRFTYPPSLNGKAQNEIQLKEEENRRLFYVAMTRAKKELHLSYFKKYPETHFLTEFKEFLDTKEPKNIDLEVRHTPPITVPKISNENIDGILQDFSISVSTLNSFLRCPLSFYFNKVLKFPAESNEAMVFGAIVHKILEGIYISENGTPENLDTKSVLSREQAINLCEKIFEEEGWKLQSARALRDDRRRALAIIDNFYKVDDYIKQGEVAIEKNIKNIKLGDLKETKIDFSEVKNFTINGKIDKIIKENNKIYIIDYKTGSARNAAKKLKGPNDLNPLGGDYWRQAVMYYILIQNSDIPDIKDTDVIIKYVFLEDDKDPRGFSESKELEITPADVNVVLLQIRDTLLKIKSGDFYCGCGVLEKKDQLSPCYYCKLVNINNSQISDNKKELDIATINHVVSNYKSLSVSTLNRFQNCHRSFYFDNVLQLSTIAGLSGSKESHKIDYDINHVPTGSVFGTAIHKTLEKIYQENLGLAEADEIFKNTIKFHQFEIINTMNLEELYKYGHQLLKNLFDNYIPNSCKNVELEKELHVTLDGNYRIKGIIDKIEYDGNIIRIVDYKTGFTQIGSEELKKGGNYWRQAVFYNLLLRGRNDIDIDGKKIETQYIFLDDQSNTNGFSSTTITINDEDMKEIETQIIDFWISIETRNFSQGCDNVDCDFCRLSKYI